MKALIQMHASALPCGILRACLHLIVDFPQLEVGYLAVALGITAIEGIGIHSFLDGIIYTVTFNVSAMTGVLTGIGLVVHEFAEGIITFSVLLKGGLSAKKAMFYAFLVAALTTPLEAFVCTCYSLCGYILDKAHLHKFGNAVSVHKFTYCLAV